MKAEMPVSHYALNAKSPKLKGKRDYVKWLESLPDHMLDLLADDGSEAAWRIMERRREAYEKTIMPESCQP